MATKVKILAALSSISILIVGYVIFFRSTISVESIPPGAKVFLNEQLIGQTPLKDHAVEPGDYKLEVLHSTFKKFESSLTIKSGDKITEEVELQPGVGRVELLSNPPGAWVEINGKRIKEVTPFITELDSGSHKVVMGKSERRVARKTLELKDGEEQTMTLTLNMDPHGSVFIEASPRGSKIEFLGTDFVYKPGLRMPMGEYSLQISRSGYETKNERFTVSYGDNRKSFKLKRAYGVLTVLTEPAGSSVELTYLSGPKLVRRPYEEPIKLPTGAIDLKARSLNFQSETKRVQLPSTGAKVSFTLERLEREEGALFSDVIKGIGENAPQMVVIPPGSFVMGDRDGSSDIGTKFVELTEPFAVSVYEVSIREFSQYVDSQNLSLSKKLKRLIDNGTLNLDSPMAHVSHKEAEGYALWLTGQTGFKYRLPTEAEWEYVARAGSDDPYFFGADGSLLCSYANTADLSAKEIYRSWETLDCDDGQIRARYRGKYRPNDFGVFDILGNVSEWVAECGLPKYRESQRDGAIPVDEDNCSSHAYRGGSWDASAEESSVTFRKNATSGNDDRGIRLLREF